MNKKQIEKPDFQLGYLLTQVSFLKQRITNSALKEIDITYIQFIIIAGILELDEDGKEITQQDIVRERRLDKAMVSNVVKTLIEKGLMTRRQHSVDKRASTLQLTEKGVTTAIEAKKIVIKRDNLFFSTINKEILFKELTTLLKQKGNTDE